MKDTPRTVPIVDRLRSADRQRVDDETPGKNRRFILTHRDELEAALALGYSLNRVFNLLRDEGVLRSDYSSFRRAARALRLGEGLGPVSEPRAKPPVPTVASPVAETPDAQPPKKPHVFQRPSDEPRVFVHNRFANKKDLL